MLDEKVRKPRNTRSVLDEREASDLLTTQEAADYIDSTENSLRCMRSKGYGPRFVKVGYAVFYRRENLQGYQATVGPSSRTKRVGRTLLEMERGAPGSTRMRP
jgi:hypothetical protein